MGIDVHVGDYYVSFRVPLLALVLVAPIVLVGAWKLGRFMLGAFAG